MEFSDELLARLRQAKRVVVFTGAGVSAESGIPTFRDALTGLWTRYEASELASAEGFLADPELVWGWYEWRRMKALKASPNPGHLAIAELAGLVPALTLVTQNVDDLHERAGCPTVLHLHGSLFRPRCFDCAREHRLPPGIPDEPEGGRRVPPPRCRHCDGPVRPGVVWFGECLPDDAWSLARRAAQECEALLSVGTSSVVWPAASLPEVAVERGALVVQVNPAPTSLDATASFSLHGNAGEVMPGLIAALRSSG